MSSARVRSASGRIGFGAVWFRFDSVSVLSWLGLGSAWLRMVSARLGFGAV